MRKRRPHVATLEEVTITRSGENALIDFADSTVASTCLQIGRTIGKLTDQQILDRFNRVVEQEDQIAARYRHVGIEVPPGRPQLHYFAPGDQWAPRGSVVRCVVDDGGPDGEAVIHIDDLELSLAEFGRMLCTYAGWGMRISFVPETDLDREPSVEVREPDE